MGELEAIERADRPATVASLATELAELGVVPGSVLMVHTAMSHLGFVAGGAHAVVDALRRVIGPGGTLVVPTHSGHLSDPAAWSNPPIPESWWDVIRDETPAFDSALTPTRQMGAVVECARHLPGFRRSDHPAVSIGAVGPAADTIVEGHGLDDGMGEGSPLARLVELDAFVLLLGVSHANNTVLHLAEYRATYPAKLWVIKHAPVLVDGVRQWVDYTELDPDADDFERLGEDFAATGLESQGQVGAGTGRLMRARDVVEFGAQWMTTNRQ